jgi:hypothetical protein
MLINDSVSAKPPTQILHIDSPPTQILHIDSPQTQILHIDSPQTQILQIDSPPTQILHIDSPPTQMLINDSVSAKPPTQNRFFSSLDDVLKSTQFRITQKPKNKSKRILTGGKCITQDAVYEQKLNEDKFNKITDSFKTNVKNLKENIRKDFENLDCELNSFTGTLQQLKTFKKTSVVTRRNLKENMNQQLNELKRKYEEESGPLKKLKK